MKKQLILAALAVTALAACTKTEVVIPTSDMQEIGFKALNQKGTKAKVYGPIASTTYPEAEHFGVYAFHDVDGTYDSGAYMDNVEISKVNTVWKNADKSYYWPSKGTLDFACYSPYEFGTGTVSASATNGVAFDGFTTSTDNAKQVDLMVADLIEDATYETDGNPAVKVVFRHVLSQLKFVVVAADDYTESNITAITVNGLTVHQINTVGDYAQTGTTVSTGAWDNVDTPEDYVIVDSDVDVNLDGSTVVDLGNPIIVLPQNATAYTWSDDTVDPAVVDEEIFEITYTIEFDNGAEETKTAYVAPDDEWLKNYKYTYKLKIGLHEILFAPEVAIWSNADAQVIEL